MSDIKLFRTNGNDVSLLEGKSVALEKSLQSLIEQNLDTFLGIRFLASEHSTGKTHGGRIDTLGMDENGCPCIIEYKRASNENVINQGLFYLDWLLDHRGEFELLVLKSLGKEAADSIEWSSPRLLCVAGDFTKYDGHAVKQMNRNIELIRYLRFDEDFLLLELVNAVQASSHWEDQPSGSTSKGKAKQGDKTVEGQLASADEQLLDLFEAVKATCLGYGDDVQFKMLKVYAAFKRLKNFVTVDVRASAGKLLLYIKVNPDTVTLEEGFTRDVRNINHWGTGDLEIVLHTQEDLKRALPLLERAYDGA
jgi:predicted transport protein